MEKQHKKRKNNTKIYKELKDQRYKPSNKHIMYLFGYNNSEQFNFKKKNHRQLDETRGVVWDASLPEDLGLECIFKF